MKKALVLVLILSGLIIPLACADKNPNPTQPTAPSNSGGPTSTPTAINIVSTPGTATATPTSAIAAPPYINSWKTAAAPNGLFLGPGTELDVAEGDSYLGVIETYDWSTGNLTNWYNAVVDSGGTTLAFNKPLAVFTNNLNGLQYVMDGKQNSTAVTVWGGDGPGPAGPVTIISYGALPLKSPQGFTQDSNGAMYIADTGNSLVENYAPNTGQDFSHPLHKWGGYPPDIFKQPVAVACDSANNVYVGDAGYIPAIIQEYTSGGITFINQWTLIKGSVINGLAIDGSNNMYVADAGNNLVEEYDSSGNLLRSWGVPLSVHEFLPFTPASIVLTGTNILVGDTKNDLILEFGP